MIKKCKIKVYDYYNKLQKFPKPGIPECYKVEAWCAGGEKGFRALFIVDNYVIQANGDDGNWWITGRMDKRCMDDFMDMATAMFVELRVKGELNESNTGNN